MPSTSKKQHNFMEAIAHSPSFAKKVGVPQSVGKDFSTADKGRKFSKGGDTMATKGVNPFAKFEKSSKDKMMDKKAMGMKKMASGGGTGKGGGAGGGSGGGSGGGKTGGGDGGPFNQPGGGGYPMKKGGMTKMASGGSASSRADGVASKGKTKGTFVKMNKGGMSC